MTVWLWFLFDVLIGAVDGHAVQMIRSGTAIILAVSLVTAVFTRTLGLAAVIPVILMLAGVPASGEACPSTWSRNSSSS